MNDEYIKIDPTEWLPKHWETIYEHRIKKGDITINRGEYRSSSSVLPIDILLEKDIISYKQHSVAKLIVSLRRAIRHSLGIEHIVSEYFPQDGSESISAMAPSVMLNSLFHGLNKWQQNLVDRITCLPRGNINRDLRPMTENDVKWISHCSVSVGISLNRVLENRDRMKKDIDERRKRDNSENTQGATSVP